MPEPDAIEPAVQAPAPVAAEPERRVQFADPVEVTGVQPEQQPVAETAGLRRSSRGRQPRKQAYEPTLTAGQRYPTANVQLEQPEVVHPDAHLFFQATEEEPQLVSIIMTQLSLHKGLKTWGKKAREAALAEMKQLHMRDTFNPKSWSEHTQEQKDQVLESHMFLKKKRCGKIKGRTVAGGNKQRDFISREDASSPTVATESVLLTCVVDATEGRDVAVIDIPNAFIQTKAGPKDRVIIRVRGILVDLLLETAQKVYESFVSTDKKGAKTLLLECNNAIYGTVVASLLYYRKFRQTVERNGFEINPYDPCVANRVAHGKQQTICWHVDDCKLSGVKSANDEFIEVLRSEYENIFEDGSGKMTVSRGKKHKYLGMNLDYSTKGVCKIDMFEYVDEILQEFDKAFPKYANKEREIAAPTDLFEVKEQDDDEKLGSTDKEGFHSIVAKILFATKRARPDTGTAMSFLMTRVREPTKHDLKKLAQLVSFMRKTKRDPLVLGSDGIGVLKWYIDGAHAVHPNCRGHTGGGLTLGRGFPYTVSSKQKLNTPRVTETEIVGVSDLMPNILWTRNFMEAQGYAVTENIVYQDNKSAILLEKNGRSSCSKRTKHIKVRFFFVTDQINKKELSVEWCPTEDMTGDYYTKPLQGAAFHRFRDNIMGKVAQPKPRGAKPVKKSAPKKGKTGKSKKGR